MRDSKRREIERLSQRKRRAKIDRGAEIARKKCEAWIRNEERKYHAVKRGVEIYLLMMATRHLSTGFERHGFATRPDSYRGKKLMNKHRVRLGQEVRT